MKSVSELLVMNLEELQKLLEDSRRDLFHARTKIRAGELKNVSSVRPLKAGIARILTVIKQKSNVTNM